ncbi:MAG: translation initiation factor IF-2 N-terminal domain-containing protein, partial [Streptococcus mitis]|nr:translation initiation factor IF-2 N-terminal domain-containing protein [Streptococcus mitis]
MSKKRLYEIAKELGKESKEVVARAKELGLDVKSHSSSVEEAVAAKIAASFKPAAAPKAEAKPAAPKASAEKKAEKSEQAKPAVAREEAKAAEPVAPKTEKVAAKPQSRNFKAEREARAKEQAERRKQNKGNNRDQQKGNHQKNDNRNGGKQGQGNRDNRRFNDQAKKQQGQQNRGNERRQQEDKRPNQAAPRIDFKARAAALKAEQNAEYARSSEERFKQYQAAKEALAQANKRKEPEEIFEEVAKLAEQAQQEQQVQAVIEVVSEKKEPAVDTRRKKQARPDKERDDYDHEEDGPRKNQKNRSSQNQVRNQKNSNWNNSNNKKNKKGNKQNNRNQAPKPVTERKFHELPTEFEYTDGMTVAEIAKRIKREPAEIVKKLFMMGVMATQNQSLDGETIELLMVDYGIEAKQKVEVDNADIERFFVEDGYLNEDELVERPPVVTIMGHVDHGKTTLLDTLRNSRVATGEAGGITQHIGAYQIVENGKKITFLDTPGHAAFTSMRARGASVTDITILVVAADDGVMPQTIEAINHSKAANVPIIVAINKIDKPGANPERVIGELAEHGVMSTAWGGDSEFVEISAKFGQNIEELLETVLLVAEVEELKADPSVRAIGTVIEARLDKGKGAVATLLVQQGT